MCGLDDVGCLAQNSKYWRQLGLPPPDLKEELDENGLSCNCPSGTKKIKRSGCGPVSSVDICT